MANLKDLIVNGAARIIGKTYSSEFVGNVTGNVTGNLTGNAATASKLGTTTVGGDTKPIYLKAGVATAVSNPVIPLVSNGDMSGADVSTVQGAGVLLKDETTGTVWNIHTHAGNLRMYNGSTEKILSENGHTHSYAGSSSVGGPATDFAAEAGTASTDRYVYFAYDDPTTYNNPDSSKVTKGRAVVDSDFKYNPGTNTLTAGTFKGNLAASNITGTLGVGHGGTGIASFTAGDILYASGTSTLATLNKGTDGQVLKLSGGKPAWGTDNTPTKFAWTNGTTAGPTGSLTGNGMSAVAFSAIPSASESASGIVTTGAQAFAGAKTFNDTITTRTNTGPALTLRDLASTRSTINYDTQGNEALAINLNYPSTSFMVNHGVDGAQWTAGGKWMSVAPTLQAKNKCVYINELIPNDTSPSYNLKVNGTACFSDKVYIGGSSSYISYNSSTGALEFNC